MCYAVLHSQMFLKVAARVSNTIGQNFPRAGRIPGTSESEGSGTRVPEDPLPSGTMAKTLLSGYPLSEKGGRSGTGFRKSIWYYI